jgi:4-hydroxy 2-oxovalerate aldolase
VSNEVDFSSLVASSRRRNYPPTVMLDVTLRDGGFMNDFGWSEDFIVSFAILMSNVGFAKLELGYVGGVSAGSGWYEGRAANLTPDFIAEIVSRCSGMELLCIVNPWRMKATPDFHALKQSGLRALRVAYNPTHWEKVGLICDGAANASLPTYVNISSVSRMTTEDISLALKRAHDWGARGAFFADTSSALRPDEIAELYRLASEFTAPEFELGLHGHDFSGFGMGNALAAARNGASIIDVSIRGAGRGGGNVRAECWAIANALAETSYEIDVRQLVQAVDQVSDILGLNRISMLPFVTASLDINPEALEKFCRANGLVEQNELAARLVIEVLRSDLKPKLVTS